MALEVKLVDIIITMNIMKECQMKVFPNICTKNLESIVDLNINHMMNIEYEINDILIDLCVILEFDEENTIDR